MSSSGKKRKTTAVERVFDQGRSSQVLQVEEVANKEDLVDRYLATLLKSREIEKQLAIVRAEMKSLEGQLPALKQLKGQEKRVRRAKSWKVTGDSETRIVQARDEEEAGAEFFAELKRERAEVEKRTEANQKSRKKQKT